MILARRHRAVLLALLAGLAPLAGCSDSNQPASSKSPSGREDESHVGGGDRASSSPSGRDDERHFGGGARGSSQAPRLGGYLNESDPLLNALVKRFDEAAVRVEALKQELSKMSNADPFMGERQAKFRAMAEEMERAKGDVEILRKQAEALQAPQEGQAYHRRVLMWMRGVEDYFPAQKKFYEDSAAFWTEKRDTGAWAAYSLQLRRTDELREQLKKEIHRVDQGRRELAEQFGLPSVATR